MLNAKNKDLTLQAGFWFWVGGRFSIIWCPPFLEISVHGLLTSSPPGLLTSGSCRLVSWVDTGELNGLALLLARTVTSPAACIIKHSPLSSVPESERRTLLLIRYIVRMYVCTLCIFFRPRSTPVCWTIWSTGPTSASWSPPTSSTGLKTPGQPSGDQKRRANSFTLTLQTSTSF